MQPWRFLNYGAPAGLGELGQDRLGESGMEVGSIQEFYCQ